ncbi:MAG: hypothetical protein OXN83_01170 [Oligoflexia bacterium]|nr:hypothetical protein [Oligoflexia bacterium]
MIPIMIHFLLICSCVFFFSLQAEESVTAVPFMSEAHPVKKETTTTEKKRKKASVSEDDSNKTIQKAEQIKTLETEEDYSPSLTESLNASNNLKNQIKRQLARNNLEQTNLEENSSEEEIVNFGNFSIGISERKKEEDLVEKKK